MTICARRGVRSVPVVIFNEEPPLHGWLETKRRRTAMTTIGFIGLGVMGGPMCRNIALKHAGDVIAFDLAPAAAEAVNGTKARFVPRLQDIWALADAVFLSLPGGAQVEAV